MDDNEGPATKKDLEALRSELKAEIKRTQDISIWAVNALERSVDRQLYGDDKMGLPGVAKSRSGCLTLAMGILFIATMVVLL